MGQQQLTLSDVAARAQTVLRKSPVHALRSLTVRWDGEQLMLLGRVCSFYHKQLAQEVIRAVAKDIRVRNKIEVNYRPATLSE